MNDLLDKKKTLTFITWYVDDVNNIYITVTDFQ